MNGLDYSHEGLFQELIYIIIYLFWGVRGDLLGRKKDIANSYNVESGKCCVFLEMTGLLIRWK